MTTSSKQFEDLRQELKQTNLVLIQLTNGSEGDDDGSSDGGGYEEFEPPE